MIRGERFDIDLGPEDVQGETSKPASLPGSFVGGDIRERQPTAAPTAPTLRSKSGFPEHRKRAREGRFQQSKGHAIQHRPDGHTSCANETRESREGGNAKPKTWEEEERGRIDHENRQKLAAMTAMQIEEERHELMNSLSPAFLQRLLRRSHIDSGSNETDLSRQPKSATAEQDISTLSGAQVPPPTRTQVDPGGIVSDAPQNGDHDAAFAEVLPPEHDSLHFPHPPQPPELDPSSDTFLTDLHEKYFPSLPAEPDKLEWMQSSSSTKNAYDPSAPAFHAKDLRFSFKGELIPPRTALDIPVTAGLHHHGDAPDAAGYTIPELAHLSRSSYAAQRCVAFQTLGRILYRLGKGEFGDAGEPGADTVGAGETLGELARGLWHLVEMEKVIETLVLESEGQGADRGRHVSARAYATEAVFLWRKGGGRRWKAN